MIKRFFAFLQYLLPTYGVSRVVGYFANHRCGWFKNIFIQWFVWHYQVNLEEAEKTSINDYATFNDFFTRKLKAETRPIDSKANTIICPVDGLVSQIGEINQQNLVQAKGRTYELKELIVKQDYVNHFENGKFATLYLSPKDYHHVHMPVHGKLIEMIYVPGRLFSVNPSSTEHIPHLFSKNERVICVFETDIGLMSVILIGAFLVGSIHTVFEGKITPSKVSQIKYYSYFEKDIHLNKGDLLGHFELGSTTILLFEPQKIDWFDHLNINDRVQVGQLIGSIIL